MRVEEDAFDGAAVVRFAIRAKGGPAAGGGMAADGIGRRGRWRRAGVREQGKVQGRQREYVASP